MGFLFLLSRGVRDSGEMERDNSRNERDRRVFKYQSMLGTIEFGDTSLIQQTYRVGPIEKDVLARYSRAVTS